MRRLFIDAWTVSESDSIIRVLIEELSEIS